MFSVILSIKSRHDIAVRQGIPQGSLASPYLASKLLEPLLHDMRGGLILSYADDIIVGCGSKKVAQANEKVLRDLLEDHLAGPLIMKSSIARLGEPIDILGYRLRRRWPQYGGGVRLTPSPKAFAKFELKIVDKLVACSEAEFEDVACDYPTNWMNSNPNWDRSPAGDQLLWMDVEQFFIPAARSERKKMGKNTPSFFPLPG